MDHNSEQYTSAILRELESKTKEESISKVLNEIAKRPLFVSLEYSKSETPEIRSFSSMLHKIMGDENSEVVGSTVDSLKVSKAFYVGDADKLKFSRIVFDANDESTFEYKQESPCFFHIPQPQKISPLSVRPVDGKYMSAHAVRSFHPILFGEKKQKSYFEIMFPVAPFTTITTDRLKCATTYTQSYADPVSIDTGIAAPMNAINFQAQMVWWTEHILLSYLIMLKNEQQVKFVGEILYGEEFEEKGILSDFLNQLLSIFRQDFQKTMFSSVDLLYFNTPKFEKLLQKAIDKEETIHARTIQCQHGELSLDLVPAIKCDSWPRPAEEFKYRKRIWPSVEVIDRVVRSGFQIVPKASGINPQPEKDFIISFSPAEVILARELPELARTSYCLLKLCYKCIKGDSEEQKSLKTFHLKTALFWIVERTDPAKWQECDLLWAMRTIIEFLLDGLMSHRIPSYFVSANNLIADFEASDIDRISKILIPIHENPANYIKLIIDIEWRHTNAITSEENFQLLKNQGDVFFREVPWLIQMKLSCQHYANIGGYPFEDDTTETATKMTSESFYSDYLTRAMNSSPPGVCPVISNTTDEQLKNIEIFLRTTTKMGIDFFNVLNADIDESILQSSLDWISLETLQELYPCYDQEEDNQFGLHFTCMLKMRLKFYANVFHFLCQSLMMQSYQQTSTAKNEDFKSIVKFLIALRVRRNFDIEDILDLLHSLLYFCHFTQLRHHNLKIEHQIVRSIREFLQDAKHMMTVYFNPRVIFPMPVDVGDNIETLLGGTFL